MFLLSPIMLTLFFIYYIHMLLFDCVCIFCKQ